MIGSDGRGSNPASLYLLCIECIRVCHPSVAERETGTLTKIENATEKERQKETNRQGQRMRQIQRQREADFV